MNGLMKEGLMDDQMDERALWKTALGELEVVISKPNFNTWFRNTFIYEINGEVITIGAPNSFILGWLQNKFSRDILTVLQRHLPNKAIAKVEFKIAQPQTTKVKPVGVAPAPAQPETIDEPTASGGLNHNYTFDNFIVGTHNRLAHAAALAVASAPGKRHNPLFIYGGVGLGKTHLLQAIGNTILKRWPKKQILYASCEVFANEFIRAIQSKKTDPFKAKFRNADVLLIDDIQFLAGKDGTQEEFFHTFNALHQASRQIVLTSDRMPQAIAELEERLSSRLVWGMVTDIKSPNLETRAAILHQKCLDKGAQLPKDVIDFLVRTFPSNIRELEGALNQILAYTELEKTEPTKEMAEELLKNRGPIQGTNVSMEKIITAVSHYYQVDRDDILGVRRHKEFVGPRQVVMYLLRHELGSSYPQIGRELKKDHTTIIHGVEKLEKELPRNGQLQQEIARIKDNLYH